MIIFNAEPRDVTNPFQSIRARLVSSQIVGLAGILLAVVMSTYSPDAIPVICEEPGSYGPGSYGPGSYGQGSNSQGSYPDESCDWPPPGNTTPPPDPSPSTTQVLTIGDSFAAGTGYYAIRARYDDHECMREDDDTHGPRIAEYLGAQHTHAACQGAGVGGTAGQWRENSHVVPGTGDTSLVVVTAGGNSVRSNRDDGWAGVIARCQFLQHRCNEDWLNNVANLELVGGWLENLYREILADRPDVKVRVMGYPELFQPTPHCRGVSGIHRHEGRWLDEQALTLNDRISLAVSNVRTETGGDIRYVDVVDDFHDRGACRSNWTARWIRDISPILESIPSRSGYHPKPDGYDAFYKALRDSL